MTRARFLASVALVLVLAVAGQADARTTDRLIAHPIAYAGQTRDLYLPAYWRVLPGRTSNHIRFSADPDQGRGCRWVVSFTSRSIPNNGLTAREHAERVLPVDERDGNPLVEEGTRGNRAWRITRDHGTGTHDNPEIVQRGIGVVQFSGAGIQEMRVHARSTPCGHRKEHRERFGAVIGTALASVIGRKPI